MHKAITDGEKATQIERERIKANQEEIKKQIAFRRKSLQNEKYWDKYEAQKHMVTEIT